MNWDTYFLSICNAVSKRSKCASRQVGAIIVLDKAVISTGYNGPPRGVPECSTRCLFPNNKCPRREKPDYKSGANLDLCVAAHAERNAIVQAARSGTCISTATLYTNDVIPCKDCIIEIINSGIIEVVVTERIEYNNLSQYLVVKSGLVVRQYHLEEL